MKTIFLDIDGVLNHSSTKERCGAFLGVDRRISDEFLRIIKDKEVQIILSSTWRLHPEMHQHLNDAGIFWKDITPQGGSRGDEIQAYLESHKDIKDFVILDDMYVLDIHRKFHIQPDNGLKKEHFAQLRAMLA